MSQGCRGVTEVSRCRVRVSAVLVCTCRGCRLLGGLGVLVGDQVPTSLFTGLCKNHGNRHDGMLHTILPKFRQSHNVGPPKIAGTPFTTVGHLYLTLLWSIRTKFYPAKIRYP